MQISVIVPVYDEAEVLPRFLADLRRRLHDDADRASDCVIVDGGSGDGTVDVLRDGRAPWITAERGRGPQMNAGAAATRGEVLLFLHADTRLPPGAFQAIRRAVDGGAVGGFFRVRLDSGRTLLRLVGRGISLRSRITGIATGDQAIFVTRRAFEALGGYAPLELFEDVDLSRRLRRRGRVAALPLTVVTSARRWERLGPWRTILRLWLLRVLYYCGMSPERLARYHEPAR